jgi:lincosamide nucleotidyltransferase A/C/D/E
VHQEASQELVLAFLESVNGISIWIDGGWGVDALLGSQTRPHADLDIIIAKENLPSLESALLEHSFERDRTQEGIVFVSTRGLRLDIHLVHFDARGYGNFDFADGRVWPFPPSAFAGKGKIGDLAVHCLSPEAQVQCHAQGYEPTAKDLRDMEALQRKYGVVLPLALCREGHWK